MGILGAVDRSFGINRGIGARVPPMVEQEHQDQQSANGSIEAAFAAAEADAEAALKAATGLVKALKRAHGAARQGQVRDWQTAVEAARQGLTAVDRQVDNLGAS